MKYEEFLERKTQCGCNSGFEPLWMPDMLFDFQKSLTTWAIMKGRAAVFADCGLGKTFMQLVWAENVARKTNGRKAIGIELKSSYYSQAVKNMLSATECNQTDKLI